MGFCLLLVECVVKRNLQLIFGDCAGTKTVFNEVEQTSVTAQAVLEKAYWSAWNMLLRFPAQQERSVNCRLLGEKHENAERDVLMELGEVRCLL